MKSWTNRVSYKVGKALRTSCCIVTLQETRCVHDSAASLTLQETWYVHDFINRPKRVIWLRETGLSHPVKYLRWPFQGDTSFVAHLCYLCLVFLMLSRQFITVLSSPARKGLTSWFLFVMLNCVLSLYHVVSSVSCGTWLYRFLIFAAFLTLLMVCILYYQSCINLTWLVFRIFWITFQKSQNTKFPRLTS